MPPWETFDYATKGNHPSLRHIVCMLDTLGRGKNSGMKLMREEGFEASSSDKEVRGVTKPLTSLNMTIRNAPTYGCVSENRSLAQWSANSINEAHHSRCASRGRDKRAVFNSASEL